MRHIAGLACAAVCWAQLSSPLIGYVRTSANELRPVLGVTGAFMLGDPLERDVLSAAFTPKTGLVKKDTEVLLYREGRLMSRHSAPAGRAAFRFTPGGEPASMRLESGDCQVWTQRGFRPAPEAACAENSFIEQVGDDWFALHTKERILLKRGEQTWHLPE